MESKAGVTVEKMMDRLFTGCVTSGNNNEPWCGKSFGENAMKVEKLASALWTLIFNLDSGLLSRFLGSLSRNMGQDSPMKLPLLCLWPFFSSHLRSSFQDFRRDPSDFNNICWAGLQKILPNWF